MDPFLSLPYPKAPSYRQMAQPSLLVAATGRSSEDGDGQWSREAITLDNQGYRRKNTEEGGAWIKGEGDRSWAEGGRRAVGEDDEGKVGEKEAGYVGDVEVGAAAETGKHSSQATVLRDGADDLNRGGTAEVGRNDRNDSFRGSNCVLHEIQSHLMESCELSRHMSPEQTFH